MILPQNKGHLFNSLEFMGVVNQMPTIVFGTKSGLTSFWLFPTLATLHQILKEQESFRIN